MKLVREIKFIQALHSTVFVRLWIGQTISSIGDGAFNVALAWEILLLTRSGTVLGVVMIAETIPMVLFLLIGGVAADRFPRRVVMLCSDVTRMVVLLIITGLISLHLLQLWHLITLAIIFGTAQGFFYPSYQALIPQLIKTDDLHSANALTRLSKQMSGLFGPMIGAGCITLVGPAGAFALDGLTFGASVCSLMMIQVSILSMISSQRNLKIHDSGTRFKSSMINSIFIKFLRGLVTDIQDGLKYVASSTWLWVSIIVAAIVNIGLEGPLDVALPKIVYSVYGTGVWLLGMLYTAFAIGSIIATIFFGQLRHIPHRGISAYLALMGAILSLIVLGLPLQGFIAPSISLIAIALIGFGLGFFGLIWVTVLQELVPEDKLGRVNSIDWLCSFGLTPIGFAITGVLADQIGPSWTFIFGGILGLVMISIALGISDIRNLE